MSSPTANGVQREGRRGIDAGSAPPKDTRWVLRGKASGQYVGVKVRNDQPTIVGDAKDAKQFLTEASAYRWGDEALSESHSCSLFFQAIPVPPGPTCEGCDHCQPDEVAHSETPGCTLDPREPQAVPMVAPCLDPRMVGDGPGAEPTVGLDEHDLSYLLDLLARATAANREGGAIEAAESLGAAHGFLTCLGRAVVHAGEGRP